MSAKDRIAKSAQAAQKAAPAPFRTPNPRANYPRRMTLDLDDHRADWVKDTAFNLSTSRRKLSGAQLLRALIDLAETDPDVLRRAGELAEKET